MCIRDRPDDVPEQEEAFDGQIDGFEGASADETLIGVIAPEAQGQTCLLYTSPSALSALIRVFRFRP